jgi:hypothetical protein
MRNRVLLKNCEQNTQARNYRSRLPLIEAAGKRRANQRSPPVDWQAATSRVLGILERRAFLNQAAQRGISVAPRLTAAAIASALAEYLELNIGVE